jgi:hypothetical protein
VKYLLPCLLLLATCQKNTPIVEPKSNPTIKEPAAQIKRGEGGFPLPADATDEGPAPGGGGKILTYDVPRGRDIVAEDLRKLLQSDGWRLDEDELSPRGSIRITTTKDGATFKVSIAGDGERSKIILTVP